MSLLETAHAVAAELGATFIQLTDSKTGQTYNSGVLFFGDPSTWETPQLSFSLDDRRDRIVVGTMYHTMFAVGGTLRYSETMGGIGIDEITCSPSKAPKLIAGDIKRKALPEFFDRYAAGVARIKDLKDRQRQRAEKMLALGIDSRHHDNNTHYVDGIRCTYFTHDTVRIDGLTVTYEQLAKIREVLK